MLQTISFWDKKCTEIFHKRLSQHFDNIEGVETEQIGLTLNKEKCEINTNSFKYLGHHLSENENWDESIQLHVRLVIRKLPIADQRLQEIENHTTHDDTMMTLRDVIINGWPETKD